MPELKEHPGLAPGPNGIFRDDQRIDCYLRLAELHLEMNQPEQARPFARQAETVLDHYPFPPPPPLDAELRREARALVTVLDRAQYTEAYEKLRDFCVLFDRFNVDGNDRVHLKMQLERFHTRLTDLRCELGELAPR